MHINYNNRNAYKLMANEQTYHSQQLQLDYCCLLQKLVEVHLVIAEAFLVMAEVQLNVLQGNIGIALHHSLL